MLHGHDDIPVVFIAFDVLHARGESTLRLPYRQRRELLEALDFQGDHWSTGRATRMAKRSGAPSANSNSKASSRRNAAATTAPVDATWVKVKNREYWRYPLEVEGALNRHARSQVG